MTAFRSICVLALGTTLLATGAMAADPESEFRGRRLAETNCGSCHAITLYDEGAVAEAPAFRDLRNRLSLQELRREMAGDFFLRHPDMPPFEPTQDEANDLADYIESIEE